MSKGHSSRTSDGMHRKRDMLLKASSQLSQTSVPAEFYQAEQVSSLTCEVVFNATFTLPTAINCGYLRQVPYAWASRSIDVVCSPCRRAGGHAGKGAIEHGLRGHAQRGLHHRMHTHTGCIRKQTIKNDKATVERHFGIVGPLCPGQKMCLVERRWLSHYALLLG